MDLLTATHGPQNTPVTRADSTMLMSSNTLRVVLVSIAAETSRSFRDKANSSEVRTSYRRIMDDASQAQEPADLVHEPRIGIGYGRRDMSFLRPIGARRSRFHGQSESTFDDAQLPP